MAFSLSVDAWWWVGGSLGLLKIWTWRGWFFLVRRGGGFRGGL